MHMYMHVHVAKESAFTHTLQANGLDERFNQTLQNMLVKYVSGKREQWNSYLDTCVFAYNTSRQESSKYTPFFLMFGRRATLPVDINLNDESASEKYQQYNDLEDPDISTLERDRQALWRLMHQRT